MFRTTRKVLFFCKLQQAQLGLRLKLGLVSVLICSTTTSNWLSFVVSTEHRSTMWCTFQVDLTCFIKRTKRYVLFD